MAVRFQSGFASREGQHSDEMRLGWVSRRTRGEAEGALRADLRNLLTADNDHTVDRGLTETVIYRNGA